MTEATVTIDRKEITVEVTGGRGPAANLSSWTGSTNITTLGTITAGTWTGTAIADSYISSAATWNAKVSCDATNVASVITGATEKTTPADADQLALTSSADSGALKRLTFANLWAWIKSKLDTALTIAGAKTWSGQQEATGQSATNGTSLMTRDLGDARYFRHVQAYSTSVETVANSSTLVSSANVAVALDAGTWAFEAYFEIQTTATTSVGVKSTTRFTGTASATNIVVFRASPSSLTPLNQSLTLDNSNTTLPYSNTSPNGSFAARLTGRIVVTVAGTLEVQFAQNTASAGNSATLRPGSFIVARKIA